MNLCMHEVYNSVKSNKWKHGQEHLANALHAISMNAADVIETRRPETPAAVPGPAANLAGGTSRVAGQDDI
jgi:hypothetical protein